MNDPLEALRDAALAAPSLPAFRDICDILDDIPASADVAIAMDYVRHHLSSWPDRIRTFPPRWFEDPNDPELIHPRLEVGRRVALTREPTVGLLLKRVLSSPRVERVTAIDLDHCELRHPEDLGEALTSPACASLHTLTLQGIDLSGEALTALALFERDFSLHTLDLVDDALEDQDILDMLAAPMANASSLRRLSLASNDLGDTAAIAIAYCAELSGLDALILLENSFAEAGYDVLFAGLHVPPRALVIEPAYGYDPLDYVRDDDDKAR